MTGRTTFAAAVTVHAVPPLAPLHTPWMTQVKPEADYDEMDGVLALSGPGFYLTIRIVPEELGRLSGVRHASWEDRASIKAGEALGHPVFWCRSPDDPTAVTVLVGGDDETWDLALEVPAEVLFGALPS